MTDYQKLEPAVRDEWHVLGSVDELALGRTSQTTLFGHPVRIVAGGDRLWEVVLVEGLRPLPVIERYGYLWSSLGEPARDLFALPEFAEPDRRNLNAASIRVHVSAPRTVENFLDLGHFPFVHTGYLGQEPHTEVKPYDVEVASDGNEIVATRCRFYQPRAAAKATDGADVEYVYRVPHPYCAVLYKANAAEAARQDVIALFGQPLDEEHTTANMLLSLVDDVSSVAALRAFQQAIFGQDKPILENQVPKRLPLTPKAELPTRADATSMTYRLWLRQRKVRYGTA